MSKMGSHDSFGHLKHKLWPKEGLGVSTIKSRESSWFPCVQVSCHVSLDSSQRGLQLCFRLHLNRKFMWVIELLVNLPSPITKLQHAPLPPKCYKPGSAPNSFSFYCSPLDPKLNPSKSLGVRQFHVASGFVKLQFASMVGNKKVFSNVALIIPDKESCIGSNVDVYLGCSLFFMNMCIGGENIAHLVQ